MKVYPETFQVSVDSERINGVMVRCLACFWCYRFSTANVHHIMMRIGKHHCGVSTQ